MLATKCGAGNKVSTRLHQHEDDEEGRDVFWEEREKRKAIFRSEKCCAAHKCARAMGVRASLDP